MDHDKLFKQLLRTFFVEFVELFLPAVSAYLARETIQFVDEEIFTDLTTQTERFSAAFAVGA